MKPRHLADTAASSGIAEQMAQALERAALELRALAGSSETRLAILCEPMAHGKRAPEKEAAPTVPKLLTADDLAALLQIDTRTLRRLRTEGKAPPEMQIGSLPRWHPDAVARWMEEGT
jgi:hypothetical protein